MSRISKYLASTNKFTVNSDNIVVYTMKIERLAFHKPQNCIFLGNDCFHLADEEQGKYWGTFVKVVHAVQHDLKVPFDDERDIFLSDFAKEKGFPDNIETSYFLLKIEVDAFSMVSLLIANGADINVKTFTNKTSLHYALLSGKREIAELLISKGAETNVLASRMYSGEVHAINSTPLTIAVRMGDYQNAKLLLANGADVNYTDSVYGESALHIACGDYRPDESEKKIIFPLMMV